MMHSLGRRLIRQLGMESAIPDISLLDKHEENKRITRLEITIDAILGRYLGEHPPIKVYRKRSYCLPFGKKEQMWIPAQQRLGVSRRYFDEGVTAFRHAYGICVSHKSIEQLASEANSPGTKHVAEFYDRQKEKISRDIQFVTELLRQNHREEIWYSTMIQANTSRKDYKY